MKAKKAIAIAMAAVMLLAGLAMISATVSSKPAPPSEPNSFIISPKDGGVMYIGEFNPIKIQLSKDAMRYQAAVVISNPGDPNIWGISGLTWFPGDGKTVYMDLREQSQVALGPHELRLIIWQSPTDYILADTVQVTVVAR